MKWSDDLKESDFREHAIWREASAEPGDRGWKMIPITALPAKSLERCWVGSLCEIANGRQHFFVLRFLSERDKNLNKHFATLIAFVGERLVQLRRYHSPDLESATPQDFASQVGLLAEELFPVRYDLTSIATGNAEALSGAIQEPLEDPMTEDELMDLALSSMES